jgi:hypothetical protein
MTEPLALLGYTKSVQQGGATGAVDSGCCCLGLAWQAGHSYSVPSPLGPAKFLECDHKITRPLAAIVISIQDTRISVQGEND